MKKQKFNRKKNNTIGKLKFITFLCIFAGIAIFFSKFSLGRFFAAIAIEAVFVVAFWIFTYILKNRRKDKLKNKLKNKQRLSRHKTDLLIPNEPIEFIRNRNDLSEVDSGFSHRHQRNFDWVIKKEVPKETEPEIVIEKTPEVYARDLKTEVANWSKLVHYSGTVFDNIKEKSTQKSKNDEENLAEIGETKEKDTKEESENEGTENEETIEETEETEETVETVETEEETEEETVKEETVKEESVNEESEKEDSYIWEAVEAGRTADDETDSAIRIDMLTEIQNEEIFFENEALEPEEENSKNDSIDELNFRYDKELKSLNEVLDKNLHISISNKPEKPEIEAVANSRCNDGNINYTKYNQILPIELLFESKTETGSGTNDYNPEDNAVKLIDTLASFGVGAKIINISEGPSVTRYEIQPDYGVKVSKIVNLTDDIALNLAATGVRIEAPIPGKAAVGIEIPNKEVIPVLLRDVIGSEEFINYPSKLAFAVGKDVTGNAVIADIARMPHLLIAGATGSGKSVCINTLIASILYKASPSEVKLLMVDPKVVELSIYNGIPLLLIPVVTDPKKAAGALNWAVVEMTSRYKLFADNNVRDLKGYNLLKAERGESDILPQIVIIVDELADLMMVAPNDVEDCICRLAQMARAAGMHLVIATQRPSVDVITGVIKANIPSRISFAVSSQIDSRTILDMAGAEKLIGRGDMLFSPIGLSKPVRVQGGFITDKEVEALVSYVKSFEPAKYDEGILEKIEKQTETTQGDSGEDDELFNQVVNMVIDHGMASTSFIQRKFKLGYGRAARILDQMEVTGIVGPFEGGKPRKILLTKQEWQEMI